MQMSSNLSSKRTVLPKPSADLDAKAKMPEPDQVSLQTAPVSDTNDKVADDAAPAEQVKLNETIVHDKVPAEPEVQEAEVVAQAEAPKEDTKPPVEATEEKLPEGAEVKAVEQPSAEEAKPVQDEVA